jgi:hypothetical protein
MNCSGLEKIKMHQSTQQGDLLSYWVVKAYDPSIQMFSDVYKSYGQNTAQDKLKEFLGKGICAVIEYRHLPLI